MLKVDGRKSLAATFYILLHIIIYKRNQILVWLLVYVGASNKFISSVRSSSGYHGLIEIRQQQQATFSNFSNIFLKSMGFEDIKYDIPVYQM